MHVEGRMGKEPQPTDLDQKLIALRRRTAGKEMSSKRPKPDPTPADPSDDFSRRLKISHESSSKPQPKLFNPERDAIPTIRRTTEPETISDAGGSSYASRRDHSARQLFDHKKDDPVRFSVLARPSSGRPTPTPKSSGDYVSASGTSSYAPSLASTFTLSSTTDGSSASSALFDKSTRDQQPTNLINVQLKKLYREITALESKVKTEDAEEPTEDTSRVMLKGKGKHPNPNEEEDLERDKWKKQIADHKRLVEIIHNFFEISLAPSVPASLRNIPTKYNIITRLWTYGFYGLLESLRRAAYTLGSRVAREHLQDFLIYSYTFYTGLLEEPTLQEFRGGWLEALGDLARYQMQVAALVPVSMMNGAPPRLTAANLSSYSLAPPSVLSNPHSRSGLASSHSPPPPSHSLAVGISQTGQESNALQISGLHAQSSPSAPAASVGVAAARLLEVEPEKDMWKRIARDWYGMGIADQPGTGKLHRHLGMLCAGGDGVPELTSEPETHLRGMYHLVKSLTTLHPWPASREQILPWWAPHLQLHRQRPDATTIDLFVLLHGMIFTNIQLDDFDKVLNQLMSRLGDQDSPEKEWIEERHWVMMAVCNVASILEYGRGAGVKDKEKLAEKVRDVSTKVEHGSEKMDTDDNAGPSPSPSPPHTSPTPSLAYRLSLKLTFTMLIYVMSRPLRRPGPFARYTVNPYLTVLMTFLSTILKTLPVSGPTAGLGSPAGRAALERAVPWQQLAQFFAGIPRGVMASQGLVVHGYSSKPKTKGDDGPGWTMLTSGCAPPLPEDWCMRGMEWVGRKVYERGFWKTNEGEKGVEVEFLNESEGGPEEDGIVEDDDDDHKSGGDRLRKRWVRILRSAVGIADVVEGFRWVQGTREWRVEGVLEERVEMWAEEDRITRESEEIRRTRVRRDDDMDIDDEPIVLEEESDEEEEDDEMDSGEVKALKARRRYLKNLLEASRVPSSSQQPNRPKSGRRSRPKDTRSPLPILPGYTVLVMDTNILLSSLSLFASLVESSQWTIIIPLPVIMELDGLASNGGPLGEAAKRAVDYVAEHVKLHGLSLKVQTSRGNYLSGLSFRREDVDFSSSGSGNVDERNMDDLILRTAICHEEQWVDRSGMLKPGPRMLSNVRGEPVKVVLLSLDRNLRLKARSRHLPAASEKDLAAILTAAG